MKSIKQVQQETFGDVYTLEQFCELCDDGVITEYDGVGYFHNGEVECRNISIWDDTLSPKDVWGKYPYVIWYNR